MIPVGVADRVGVHYLTIDRLSWSTSAERVSQTCNEVTSQNIPLLVRVLPGALAVCQLHVYVYALRAPYAMKLSKYRALVKN